ncbi:Protein of unknown function DUF11 [Alloactinosynnema sp. L-07]|uniref:LPXTG cell wall anchor domain-containing protein n=1 Tax=Alloactinosynnema sp. L-07 TaxID=1653480 RepID=UPI00065F0566|nr:LPXTG cell wall anchor domain-containing protein [Alloactinosynnema sp. L-07]CRK62226.1 Protein of unknown function DUF11 [Alloactinosynnema sp. L-07]
MISARFSRLSAFVAVAFLGLAVGAPASAQEPAKPRLEVIGTFDKESYTIGDSYDFTVKIRNLGDTPAENIVGLVRGQLMNRTFPGDLSSEGPGATLAPGETRELKFEEGWILNPSTDTLVVNVIVGAKPVTLADGHQFSVPVKVVTHPLDGLVYADRNGNKKPDAGEGLPGLPVEVFTIYNYKVIQRAVTDDTGRFHLKALPSMRHQVMVAAQTPGVVFGSDYVAVDQTTVEVLGAVTPSRVSATVGFSERHYEVGDSAKVSIQIANLGDATVHGLKPKCESSAGHLTISDEAWGEWDPKGGGVSLDQGITKSFSVTGTVPAGAADLGNVSFTCYLNSAQGAVTTLSAVAEVKADSVVVPTTTTTVATTPTTTTPTTTTPVPQAAKGPADDLPDTGANVIGLAVGAVAALLAGVGAILFARRRRSA